MLSEHKIYVDTLFVKKKGTDFYMMVRNGHGPLPEDYEVVKSLKDVPNALANLLSFPRPLTENLRLLLTEKENIKRYEEKVDVYEDVVIDLLEKTKKP